MWERETKIGGERGAARDRERDRERQRSRERDRERERVRERSCLSLGGAAAEVVREGASHRLLGIRD